MIRLAPDLHWQPTSQEFFVPPDWSVTIALGGVNRLPLDLRASAPGQRCCSRLGTVASFPLSRHPHLGIAAEEDNLHSGPDAIARR
jgi:hypothetical protein